MIAPSSPRSALLLAFVLCLSTFDRRAQLLTFTSARCSQGSSITQTSLVWATTRRSNRARSDQSCSPSPLSLRPRPSPLAPRPSPLNLAPHSRPSPLPLALALALVSSRSPSSSLSPLTLAPHPRPSPSPSPSCQVWSELLTWLQTVKGWEGSTIPKGWPAATSMTPKTSE